MKNIKNDFKMFINKLLISGFIFDAKVKLGQLNQFNRQFQFASTKTKDS